MSFGRGTERDVESHIQQLLLRRILWILLWKRKVEGEERRKVLW